MSLGVASSSRIRGSCPFSLSYRFACVRYGVCACAHAPSLSPGRCARIITLGQEKPSGEFAVHRGQINKRLGFGFSRRLLLFFLPGSRVFESFGAFFFRCALHRTLFPARARFFHSLLCFLVHSASIPCSSSCELFFCFFGPLFPVLFLSW